MKTRSSPSYVSAFKAVFKFFTDLSHPITFLKIDNETSEALTQLFRSQIIQYQLVAPNQHRTNPAERAIKTAKNHFIDVLASVHISFPPDRWSDLLPLSSRVYTPH